MKRRIIFICAVVLTTFLQAKEISQDREIEIGKLDNGLTYYIKKNQSPKEMASLRLVVKAGALHENEDERGIAHFLEHMVFRGSENFTDGEVIEYLESVGAEFGADTNAFTAHDITCFQLEIPLENKEALPKGLLILSDLAFRAHLSQEMLDKERTVVLDEAYMREKSAGNKLWQAYFHHYFKNSRYSDRIPIIGLLEVIENCTSEEIKKFYSKWYRPDRMAVIAVGDFSVQEVRDQIGVYFGEALVPLEPVEELSVEVSFPPAGDVFLFHEPELTMNLGWFAAFYKNWHSHSLNNRELKEGIMVSLLIDLLNERYENLSQGHPSPFLGAGFHASDMTFYHQTAEIVFVPFQDRPLEALKAAYLELKRIKEFGFLKEEFARCVKKNIESVQKALENLDSVQSGEIVGQCITSFLHGSPIWDREEKLQCILEELLNLKFEEIQACAKTSIDIDSFSVGFASPIKDFLSKDEVENALLAMKTVEIQPLKNEYNTLQLENLSDRGEATITSIDSEYGYQTLELSNGMKIVLHKTDLEKGEIRFLLFAKGGKTLLQENEFSSGDFFANVQVNSGFDNLDGNEFSKYLNTNHIGFSFGVGSNMRSVSMIGQTEHQEELFKVLNAFFTKKQFSEEAWSNLTVKMEELEKYWGNDPYQVFFAEAAGILHSNHPFYQGGSIRAATLEGMRSCAQKLFSDPSEFTLVIVGDFDYEDVTECLRRYVSSIEGEKSAKWTMLPSECFPKESISVRIHRGKDSHTYNVVAFGVAEQKVHSIAEAYYQTQALSYLLTRRISLKLRNELGETYSPQVILDFPLYPTLQELNAYIVFTSTAEKSEMLQEMAIGELRKIADEGFSQEEIDMAREITAQGIKRDSEDNQYWISAHKIALLDEAPLSNVVDFQTMIQNVVTASELQRLANALFGDRPAVQITLLPEVCAVVNE